MLTKQVMAYRVTLKGISLTIFVVDMQQLLNIMSVFQSGIFSIISYIWPACWFY
jgi:hypothetical protein